MNVYYLNLHVGLVYLIVDMKERDEKWLIDVKTNGVIFGIKRGV